MRKAIIVVLCLFMLVSASSIVPTVNAQENLRTKIDDKSQELILRYMKNHLIPRYERVVFEKFNESEFNKINEDVTFNFKNITDIEPTEDLEMLLYLVSLIIAFYYTMFGANGASFSLCMATAVILTFIPICFISLAYAIGEGFLFSLISVSAIFKLESIDELIHFFGYAGTFLYLSALIPVVLFLYILTVPAVTLLHMFLFMESITYYVNENFPKP